MARSMEKERRKAGRARLRLFEVQHVGRFAGSHVQQKFAPSKLPVVDVVSVESNGIAALLKPYRPIRRANRATREASATSGRIAFHSAGSRRLSKTTEQIRTIDSSGAPKLSGFVGKGAATRRSISGEMKKEPTQLATDASAAVH